MPYGLELEDVVSSQLAWQGFAPSATEAGALQIASYHDCDGAKGVHALLFFTVTVACGECVQHLRNLEAQMQQWETMGIVVVALVADSAQGLPTVADAEAWKTTADLDAIAVVADPNFSFVLGTDKGFPNQVVVDPRSMQVVDRRVGYDGDYTTLEQLAADNAR